MALVVIGLTAGFLLVSLRQSPEPGVDLAQEAAGLEREAQSLRDSLALLPADARYAAQGVNPEDRASELIQQAAILRRSRPMPAELLATEYRLKAQALSDSLERVHSALLTAHDTLTWDRSARSRAQDKMSALLLRLPADSGAGASAVRNNWSLRLLYSSLSPGSPRLPVDTRRGNPGPMTRAGPLAPA